MKTLVYLTILMLMLICAHVHSMRVDDDSLETTSSNESIRAPRRHRYRLGRRKKTIHRRLGSTLTDLGGGGKLIAVYSTTDGPEVPLQDAGLSGGRVGDDLHRRRGTNRKTMDIGRGYRWRGVTIPGSHKRSTSTSETPINPSPVTQGPAVDYTIHLHPTPLLIWTSFTTLFFVVYVSFNVYRCLRNKCYWEKTEIYLEIFFEGYMLLHITDLPGSFHRHNIAVTSPPKLVVDNERVMTVQINWNFTATDNHNGSLRVTDKHIRVWWPNKYFKLKRALQTELSNDIQVLAKNNGQYRVVDYSSGWE